MREFRLLGCLALVAALGIPGVASSMDDAVVPSSYSDLAGIGRFAAHKPVRIVDVVDMRQPDDPSFLGLPCVGLFRVVTQDPPTVYVRTALERTLESVGLRQEDGEDPALAVTARIWRAHAWCSPTPLGAMYFLEINLVVEISSPTGQVIANVGVLGDAQAKSMSRIAKRNNWWDPIFAEALTDAMEEFVRSDGLRQALGPEVAGSFVAEVGRPRQAHSKVERIDYSKRTRPSDHLARVPAVDLSGFGRLQLEDFEMADQDFLKENPGKEVAVACHVVPARILERIGGFYPDLFSEVALGDRKVSGMGKAGKQLLIKGSFRDFQAGSAKARLLDAGMFGGGRVSFDADVSLVDVETGAEVAKFRVDVINLDVNQGELEDIIDWTADDIVRYLQRCKDNTYSSAVLDHHGIGRASRAPR